jgi:single-strand DNA-binding protein
MSVNKVILVGNLGSDPEIKNMPVSGIVIANFSVATSETRKSQKTGEKETLTEWHKVVLFDKLAEIAQKWLKKGSQVYIEGKIKTDKFPDKETGKDVYVTKIIGHELRMLGGSKDKDSGSNNSDF